MPSSPSPGLQCPSVQLPAQSCARVGHAQCWRWEGGGATQDGFSGSKAVSPPLVTSPHGHPESPPAFAQPRGPCRACCAPAPGRWGLCPWPLFPRGQEGKLRATGRPVHARLPPNPTLLRVSLQPQANNLAQGQAPGKYTRVQRAGLRVTQRKPAKRTRGGPPTNVSKTLTGKRRETGGGWGPAGPSCRAP